jgi:sulfatase maturation enzyme AslB (radical SAM superfamily)
MMPPEFIVDIISRPKYRPLAITWSGGGEPSLHKNLADFMDMAEMSRIHQGLFTNFAKPENIKFTALDWCRITVTENNIGRIGITAAKKTGFNVNYRGAVDNALVGRALAVAAGDGVDYVQVRPALNRGGELTAVDMGGLNQYRDNPLLKITDYKFEDQGKYRSYSQCEGFHFVPFIWEDGLVTVCAYFRTPEYTIGNLNESSWSEIVESIQSIKAFPVCKDCQICCKNHEINKGIHFSRLLTDRNFL